MVMMMMMMLMLRRMKCREDNVEDDDAEEDEGDDDDDDVEEDEDEDDNAEWSAGGQGAGWWCWEGGRSCKNPSAWTHCLGNHWKTIWRFVSGENGPCVLNVAVAAWKNHISDWITLEIYQSYWLPSGKLTWLWNITIFNGKIHYKWPFSIAILT